ncbi:tyrosine recombinase XerC, putative (plasmid) [Acaryochloris marina MBIC11017]|uniref:Tyrosine recombinase XerC, putative n=2 Tax=Acaryochloris marina TaxID=155978 RepID=A8ZKE4_ACAM1|nr:tyrosine-type recombinase/integrase [Acaryochloris marina]ABW31644.1 tyrosine recombinase XerC, putative [Acaryochloris marina MBIC11017]
MDERYRWDAIAMETSGLVRLEIDESAVDVDLLRAVLVEKTKPSTREGYTKDLVDFFLFVTQGESVYEIEGPKRKSEIKAQVKGELSRLSQSFVGIGRLKALELAARYRECMMQRGLQANTINRRLSAVKSMVRMARRLEMCDWTLAEVDGLTVNPYRDTRGITASQFRLMMVFVNRFSLAGARDFAMLTLLWEAGLRRSELVGCDVRHFDSEQKRLSILGKGRNEREWIDLTESGVLAISEWLEKREVYALTEPLFISLDRANWGSRLSGTSVYRIVRALAKKAGVSENFGPHKIRHSGTTTYLEMTGGDLRGAQAYSRHANLNTLKFYDDNRKQLQKKASAKLAETISWKKNTDESANE